MVKVSPLRTKTISTKVSDQEQALLESLARAEGQSLAEWVRETLLSRASTGGGTASAEQIHLGEVLALRAILLNVLFKIGTGERLDVTTMKQLVERADAGKLEKARARLAGGDVEAGAR